MSSIRDRRKKMQQEWKDSCPQLEYIGDITEEEVKKHQTIDDYWVIINENVYNITLYITKHPGGAQCIMSGNDITKNFMKFHRGHYLDLIEKLKIGKIVRSDDKK